MHSYWEKHYWFRNYDYVIIGSGIVGLNTALKLKEKFPEKSIAVIERSPIPSGASTKNAGFACYGTTGEILDDLEHISEEEVIDTIRLRWEGLKQIQEVVAHSMIQWKQCGGYEVFRTQAEYDKCYSELGRINSILEEATGVKNTIQPMPISINTALHGSCLYNKLEAQLNPGLLIRNLISLASKKDIHLHNGIEFKSYQSAGAMIELELEGDLICKAHNIIFANNAFAHNFLPKKDIVPARNQVLISHPLKDQKWKGTYHLDKGYIYFRNVGNRLLIGGARNIDPITEQVDSLGENSIVVEHLKTFSKEYLGVDDFAIEEKWSGIIATGNSKFPIIDRIEPNVYAAVRLGGMGVATGAAVAGALVKLISAHLD